MKKIKLTQHIDHESYDDFPNDNDIEIVTIGISNSKKIKSAEKSKETKTILDKPIKKKVPLKKQRKATQKGVHTIKT